LLKLPKCRRSLNHSSGVISAYCCAETANCLLNQHAISIDRPSKSGPPNFATMETAVINGNYFP